MALNTSSWPLWSLANGSEGLVYATPAGGQCYNVRVRMVIGLTGFLKVVFLDDY